MSNYRPKHVNKESAKKLERKSRGPRHVNQESLNRIEAELRKRQEEALRKQEEERRLKQEQEKALQKEEPVPVRKEKKNLSFSFRRWMIIPLAILLLLGSGFLIFRLLHKPTPPADDVTETVISDGGDVPSQEPSIGKTKKELLDQWRENKKVNSDYVAQLVFDSGIIDLPVVQARYVTKLDGETYSYYDQYGNLVSRPTKDTGNDVYAHTDWKTGEFGASLYMDYQNIDSDQNTILYGSEQILLSPLRNLTVLGNYQKNKTLRLIREDRIDHYEVAYVFPIDVNDDYDVQLFRTNLYEDLGGNRDPEFISSFMAYIKTIAAYDTGISIKNEDKVLTIVLLPNSGAERLVILCKQTEKESLP